MEFDIHFVGVPKGLSANQHLESDGFHFHFLSLPQHPLARPRLPLRVERARRELQRLAPTLVHCQDNLALAVATVRSGLPSLFTVHGVKRHEASKRAGWERVGAYADAALEPYVYNRFRHFICISDYTRRVLGARGDSYAIPNPVRGRFFSIERAISPHPLLLFVGVLDSLKRPLDLILAHRALVERYPTLEVVFCGEIPDRAYAARLHSLAGPGVRFVGRQDQAQLADWLSRATALVLPSSQENAPITIGEAMAAGLPVVATRVGGVTEMVHDGETGICYDVGIPALTAGLETLVACASRAQAMGERGRVRALRDYTPAAVAARTAAVYRELIARAATAARRDNV